MSGLVTIGTEIASGDLIGALGTFLQVSYFRGVLFHMPGGGDEAGRRIMRFLFPGVDAALYQDMGAVDGEIAITGLIVGDDWQIRMQRLRAACRAPGPATLVHPWLGTVRVIVAKTIKFTFSETELRAVRFQVSFYRWNAVSPPAADTLGAVLQTADAIIDGAQAALNAVLSVASLPLAFIGVVSSFTGGLSGLWTGLMGGGSGSSDFVAASAVSLSALIAGVPGGPSSVSSSGETYAQQIGDLLAATPAAIADVVTVAPQPMVSAGGDAVAATTTPLDPRAAATLLLAAAAAITDTLTGSTSVATMVLNANAAGSPAPALALIARAMVLAQAASCVTSIDFTSQQDAASWLATIDAALAALQNEAALSAAGNPLAFVALWQGIANLRSAIAADLNADIGRLPAVETIVLPMTLPAWLVAMHVDGDTPAGIIAAYQDIVRRNGVRHPAMVPGGPIEVLQ